MNQTKTDTQELTLRLLNGMLSGVEFSLQAERTVFIIGESSDGGALAADGGVQAQADNCIYIPAETAGGSFAILRSAAQGDFTIEFLATPGRVEPGRFQSTCVAGALCFAVKPSTERWNGNVLNFDHQMSRGGVRSAASAKPRGNLWLKALLSLLLIGLLLAAGVALWPVADARHDQQALNRMLQAPGHHFQIRQGRDQVFYVLADNAVDAAWGQQQVMRSSFDRPVRVLSVVQEQARIGRWLDQQPLRYFLLRFSSLANPSLVLSLERNPVDAASLGRLQQKMLGLMPYAEKLDIQRQSDLQVIAEAEALLGKLALSYSREGNQQNGLVYVLKGDIDDGTLGQLRQQISAFEQTYGERYIRFVLQQREDWLKGKSYKYGVDGYVQLSPRHWYFPKPL